MAFILGWINKECPKDFSLFFKQVKTFLYPPPLETGNIPKGGDSASAEVAGGDPWAGETDEDV